jgi:hypothetical protein
MAVTKQLDLLFMLMLTQSLPDPEHCEQQAELC